MIFLCRMCKNLDRGMGYVASYISWKFEYSKGPLRVVGFSSKSIVTESFMRLTLVQNFLTVVWSSLELS